MIMSTPIQTKPEDSASRSTLGKITSWEDLELPCNLLMKYKDVEGVTQNPPFQTIADAMTDKNDFIRTFKEGWVRTDSVELIEVLPMPIKKPTTKPTEE